MDITPEGTEQAAPEPSAIEVEAMEHGWRPEEEFKADPKNEGKRWRTAEDFMDRKSLFDKIDSVNQEAKGLRKTLQQLTLHNQKIEESTRKKVLEELKAERRAALEDGDHVKAEEIRDQIDEVKAQPMTVPQAPAADMPEFEEFKAKNSWYKKDKALTRYADALGKELFDEGKTAAQIFKEVAKSVREEFPEKFRNPNKDEAPEVVQSNGGARPKARANDLTEDEIKIAKNFAKQGIMTFDEYADQIRKSR